MASKKYTMMLGLLGLISTAAFAQDSTTTTPAVVDSAVTTTAPAPTSEHPDAALSAGTAADDSWIYDPNHFSNTTQQAAFVNHTAAYPGRPKDMWELGISVGPSFMFSPIDPKLGYGAGLSLRKSLGHVFSLRFGYDYSINYGQDYRLRTANAGVAGVIGAGKSYLPNFKTNLHQGSVDLIASLNSISPYHGNPHVNFYALLGYSFYYGKVGSNLLDANGDAYDWSGVNFNQGRKDIKDAVNDKLDANQSNSLFKTGTGDNADKYESNLSKIRGGNRDNAIGGGDWNTKHGVNAGLGVAFRLGTHFNLGIEQKFGFIFDNGTFSGLYIQPEQRNTILSSTRVRFNFNLGSTKNRLEPLWWVNPNNYVYNRLAVKDVLPDADGDGVTDQFDLEPNTPAGCAVDTHGRSLDTDGDGVPDCRDKQVLTPQNWFPVDADGVGTEPTPQCCKDLLDSLHNLKLAPAGCGITSLPSIHFNKSGVKLTSEAKSTLDAAVSQLQASPDCKVKLVGYGASNKRAQQLSWDRVNAVKTYLVEKGGVAEGRIIFTYGYDGDANTVDLQPTTEEGPSTVPAPHPNLQKS